MIAPIDKVLDEAGTDAPALVGGRATDRGEEACECVVKLTSYSVVGRIHIKAARLRTETSKTNAMRRCPAGPVRRAATRAPIAESGLVGEAVPK